MPSQGFSIEEELAAARREGVSHPDNLPFIRLPAKANGAGVVMVHGFSATPSEMLLFAGALAERGYTVLGVRIPGHGTTPEDLEQRRYEEWLAEVETGCRKLAGQTARIYGIGMSTGALLLLAASGRIPFSGLVLLSPYLRLQHRLAPYAWALRFVRRFQERSLPGKHRPFYYHRRPLSGVHQIHRLIRKVRRTLPEVTAPSLVVSAEGDRTVKVKSALTLYRRLGNDHKEYHRYGPDVPHVLTTEENPRWRETLELTLDFLSRLEQDPQDRR